MCMGTGGGHTCGERGITYKLVEFLCLHPKLMSHRVSTRPKSLNTAGFVRGVVQSRGQPPGGSLRPRAGTCAQHMVDPPCKPH